VNIEFKRGRPKDSRLHKHKDTIKFLREKREFTFPEITDYLEAAGIYYEIETVRGFYHRYCKGDK